MLQFFQRHKGPLTVGVLLLMPAVMLYAQTRSGEGKGALTGAVLDVAGVIERGLVSVVGFISDGAEHYIGSVSSYQELVDLRRERNSTALLEARVEELSIENERLRALANAVAVLDGPRPVGARVIGRAGRPLARLLTIDKGAGDGVRRGDGVVSQDGVVGVVLVVGRAHSDVLVLTDPASAIDVLVQRTRARGVLRGLGDGDKYAAIVEDFDRLRDVQRGDHIVTAGIGARFPPGVLVGDIVDVDDKDDLTLRAVIKPAVDIATVEHVSVLIAREGLPVPSLGDDDAAAVQKAPRMRRRSRPKPDEQTAEPTPAEPEPVEPAPVEPVPAEPEPVPPVAPPPAPPPTGPPSTAPPPPPPAPPPPAPEPAPSPSPPTPPPTTEAPP